MTNVDYDEICREIDRAIKDINRIEMNYIIGVLNKDKYTVQMLQTKNKIKSIIYNMKIVDFFALVDYANSNYEYRQIFYD